MMQQTSQPVLVFEAALLILILLACLLGNCMMCIVVFRNRACRPKVYTLLGNLAIADLGLCLFCMPFTLITLISKRWILGAFLCKINGYMNAFWIPATVFATTGISIYKCHSIRNPFNSSRAWKRIKVYVIVTWTLALMCAAGPLVGWHKFGYNTSSTQCGLGDTNTTVDYSYMAFLAVFVYSVPMIVNIVSFILLFKAVHKHSRRMDQNAITNTGRTSAQKRTAVTFLMVFLSYILSWTPFFIYGLLKIAGTKGDLAGQYLTVAYIMGFSNTVHNPIIFAFRNETFRESFKEIIFTIFGRYKRKLRTLTSTTFTSSFSFQLFNRSDSELASTWYLENNGKQEDKPIDFKRHGYHLETKDSNIKLQQLPGAMAALQETTINLQRETIPLQLL